MTHDPLFDGVKENEREFLRKLQELRNTRQSKNKSTCCLNWRISKAIKRISALNAASRGY